MSEILKTAERLGELADGIRARLEELGMSSNKIARKVGCSDNTIRGFRDRRIQLMPTTLERIRRWLDEREGA